MRRRSEDSLGRKWGSLDRWRFLPGHGRGEGGGSNFFYSPFFVFCLVMFYMVCFVCLNMIKITGVLKLQRHINVEI